MNIFNYQSTNINNNKKQRKMNKKSTFLTAALALLAFLAIPVGMWGQTTYTQITELDMTTKVVGCSAYNTSTTYTDWTIVYGANNNKGWAFFKMGGKNTTIADYNPCYIYSPAISEQVDKVTVHLPSGSLSKNGMSVNSWGLYVYSDSEMTTQVDYVAGGTITNNEGSFDFTPSTGITWAANYYYKVSWDLANTTSTNGIVCVDKITLFKESTGGDSDPSLSVSPTSIDFGSKTINPAAPYEETFEVNFANLTQDLTVSVGSGLTGVSVSPASISTTETSPVEVTVTYNPTTVGTLNGNITVSNDDDGVSASVDVSGSAYDPNDVTAYKLHTGDLVEGDYLIVYNDAAMNNVVSSDRLQYQEVSITNDIITTANAAIVWHIAPSGDYWTIYSADVNAYAASTGAKNKAQMLADGTDDKALWTVTGTDTYEFVNKKNDASSVNANLRKNGSYGFACYASSTGGALSLYKKVEYTLTIKGYSTATNPAGGYYLIASPVASVTPSTANGFIATPASDYDLYSFDPNEEYEWRNYKQGDGFDLVSGKGYLYASKYDTELIFKGLPYNGNGEVTLTYSATNTSEVNKAMNLVGNPYATKATPSKDYYTLNEDGSEIVAEPKNGVIDPMEGIFVKANYDGETMTFTPQDEQPAPQQLSQIVANLRQDRRNATIDRAIVRFGDDSQLPKFMFNEDNTKLYIPQNGIDYAVVCNEGEGEMPINFKAAQNGTYTLCFEVENLEMDQLTLIDNLTGTETNLPACPSYTFDARTTDYASRFRLVFGYTGIGENSEIANFAYYNGSEWVINGEGTLQVTDILGRQHCAKELTTANYQLSTANLPAGVYMLRLINGNSVKTQKIVVK